RGTGRRPWRLMLPPVPRPTASPAQCPLPFSPVSLPIPPFVSAPPLVSAGASALHFSTSDSLITMVSATSFVERPVCRYLLTCLQLTSPASPLTAVASTRVPPSVRIPIRIVPPCACLTRF